MFGKKYTEEDFEDLQRQEAYERHKQEQMAKGVGRFLSWYLTGGLIWFFSGVMIGSIVSHFFNLGGLELLIALLSPILVFKIPYVKENRFKATIIVIFLFFIVMAKTS